MILLSSPFLTFFLNLYTFYNMSDSKTNTSNITTTKPKANVLVKKKRATVQHCREKKLISLFYFMQNSTLAGAGAGTIEILLMQVIGYFAKQIKNFHKLIFSSPLAHWCDQNSVSGLLYLEYVKENEHTILNSHIKTSLFKHQYAIKAVFSMPSRQYSKKKDFLHFIEAPFPYYVLSVHVFLYSIWVWLSINQCLRN